MYRMLVDPDLSASMDLHHECRNAWCVNPWHLTPMTRAEHQRLHRRIRPRKTVCVNGHDLTDPSIGKWTTRKSGPRAGQPERYCRMCIIEWKRRKRAELKAQQTAVSPTLTR